MLLQQTKKNALSLLHVLREAVLDTQFIRLWPAFHVCIIVMCMCTYDVCVYLCVHGPVSLCGCVHVSVSLSACMCSICGGLENNFVELVLPFHR